MDRKKRTEGMRDDRRIGDGREAQTLPNIRIIRTQQKRTAHSYCGLGRRRFEEATRKSSAHTSKHVRKCSSAQRGNVRYDEWNARE
jgi:hypothetical protein